MGVWRKRILLGALVCWAGAAFGAVEAPGETSADALIEELVGEGTLEERVVRMKALIPAAERDGNLGALVEMFRQQAEASPESLFPLSALSECSDWSGRLDWRLDLVKRMLVLLPDDRELLKEKRALQLGLGLDEEIRAAELKKADAGEPNGLIYLVRDEFLYGDRAWAESMFTDPRVVSARDEYGQQLDRLLERGYAESVLAPLKRYTEEHPEDMDYAVLWWKHHISMHTQSPGSFHSAIWRDCLAVLY